MDKSHLPQYEMCGWLTITRKNCFVSLIWMELFIFFVVLAQKNNWPQGVVNPREKERRVKRTAATRRDLICYRHGKKIRRRVNRNNNRGKSERPDVWMAHVSHTTLACPHSFFFPDHSFIPELGFSGRSVGLAERVGWTLVTLEWGKTQTTHKKQLGMRNLGGTDGVKPGTREVNHHFFFWFAAAGCVIEPNNRLEEGTEQCSRLPRAKHDACLLMCAHTHTKNRQWQ